MNGRPAPGVRRPAAQPARAAARPAPAARTAARPRPAGGTSISYGAEDGARKVEEEAALAKQRQEQRRLQVNEPFRFSVPVGGSAECVITDDRPTFYRYEHNYKDERGFWNKHCGCVKETDNCPGCSTLGKEGTYCMYLSCIDLQPFTTKAGEEVPFSRKLFVVKGPQQKKILRMVEREGSLRGLILLCTRDGDKEPRIGNDIEIVDRMSEEDMATYVREWTDRENKVHTEYCSDPVNYEEIFPPVTAEDLQALFGVAAAPGSRAANRAALGGDARRPAPRTAARPVARRPDADGWQEPEAQGEYADEGQPQGRAAAAPARRPAPAAARPAARPAPRTAARPVARRPDEEYVEEGGEGGEQVPGDELPPEGAAPARRPAPRAAARSAPARRPAPQDEQGDPEGEPEYVDDDQPEQPAARPAPQPHRVQFRGRGPAR